ncbi:hypothetical protein Btru_075109 [Bulinus truncatus]|nr:hypothetical protein Btru_075109 [Bulinus truncatus]
MDIACCRRLKQTPCRYRHRADTDTVQIQTPCRYRHRADTDTVQIQTPCRYRHRADTDTVQIQPCTAPELRLPETVVTQNLQNKNYIEWKLAFGVMGSEVPFGVMGSDLAFGVMGTELPFGVMGAELAFGVMGSEVPFGVMGSDLAFGVMGTELPFGVMGSELAFGVMGSELPFGVMGSETNKQQYPCYSTDCKALCNNRSRSQRLREEEGGGGEGISKAEQGEMWLGVCGGERGGGEAALGYGVCLALQQQVSCMAASAVLGARRIAEAIDNQLEIFMEGVEGLCQLERALPVGMDSNGHLVVILILVMFSFSLSSL